MRRAFRISQVLLVIGALLGAARASDRERTIADMMSDLQRLQVMMAQGDKSAYGKQLDRLRAIGEAIGAARPESWKDKSETDAAVTFVLSGGQPRPIARLLESGAVPKSEDGLMRGALAYASGRELEADKLLEGVDARTVSLRLGGQLAYAQSVLKTTRDPKRAIELLDLARILAPGSLIEEAALRREILITGDQHDGDRVIFLARQYVTRFPHSIYADNFIQGLATTGVKYGLVDDLPNLGKFEALLTLVSADQRRIFLLTVAREQTLNGKFEVAGAAAEEALLELAPGSADEARARLYEASAQIVSPNFKAGVENLRSIDRSRLSRADQQLFAAVTHTAAHLRDVPSPAAFAEAGHENDVAAAKSPGALSNHNGDPVGATIDQAEAVLRSSDDLIRQSEAMP